ALRATEVGLPDFGHLLTWRKSDKSDFRWERFRVRGSHLLGGGKMRLSTCEVLGHDACIPTAARRGNRSRHVIWKYGRQRDLAPPQPAANLQVCPDIAQLRGDRRGTRDHVEQDVPLRPQNHQW